MIKAGKVKVVVLGLLDDMENSCDTCALSDFCAE